MSTASHPQHHVDPDPLAGPHPARSLRPAVVVAIALAVVLGTGVGASAARSPSGGVRTVPTVHVPDFTAVRPTGASAGAVERRGRDARIRLSYPVGTPDPSEPSRLAPPGPGALANYRLSYETDFSGHSLPAGWVAFDGTPGGDPGDTWSASHVGVYRGLLRLHAWRVDGSWVTGGVCQCGRPQTYGAYFVRSRVTGPGPTQVELLWPATNAWPPEVDFAESFGQTTMASSTDHWDGVRDLLTQHRLYLNLTQWHTFGVIWSPQQILYLVDGHPWARITSRAQIPRIPMTLDLTQQTWCSKGWACPTHGQTMGIDWVAEYTWVRPAK